MTKSQCRNSVTLKSWYSQDLEKFDRTKNNVEIELCFKRWLCFQMIAINYGFKNTEIAQWCHLRKVLNVFNRQVEVLVAAILYSSSWPLLGKLMATLDLPAAAKGKDQYLSHCIWCHQFIPLHRAMREALCPWHLYLRLLDFRQGFPSIKIECENSTDQNPQGTMS